MVKKKSPLVSETTEIFLKGSGILGNYFFNKCGRDKTRASLLESSNIIDSSLPPQITSYTNAKTTLYRSVKVTMYSDYFFSHFLIIF